MTSLTSLKHHTKIGKSKTESVLNFFPPLYIFQSVICRFEYTIDQC